MPNVLKTQNSPIAIVGMASIFANARTLDQYWDNIMEQVDAIIEVPSDRWNIDDFYDPDPFVEDKTYCKRGGFIPEVDFNPMEFGLPPNILEVTDSAQLLSLVVAKEVLKDAGVLNNDDIDRDRIGVTLGIGGGQKLIGPLVARLQGPILHRVLESSGVNEEDRNIIIEKYKKAYVRWEENSFPGMLGNVVSGRIANRFDLGGMNCVVDAACAGALAAMKMAVKDLQAGSSDMMITGGVCCDNSPFMYMSFSKTPAFSPTGIIQPFDHKSKGMLVGEGLGMVMLKRLDDAERDGDRIYAVLKGIGSSSDGKFKSIYAPRSSGQAKALNRAYEDAGIDPKSVGLIEAHGTGTAAGDIAEFEGLMSIFGADNPRKNHIALGSVKSQIGHTKSAAGVAGFIKIALALHHKVLPPTINVEKPIPALKIEDSPFYLNTETRPWVQDGDTPRRAGVSAFGFGGTNFHFVLEEYRARADGAYRLQHVANTVLLAAHDKAALTQMCSDVLNDLRGEQPKIAFQQLVQHNPIRKVERNHPRLAFVAKDVATAIDTMEKSIEQLSADDAKWSLPSSGVHFSAQGLSDAKVAGLFSGQGSQYVNMGRELACNFPPMLNLVSAMDQLYKRAGSKPSLAEVLYPNPVFSKEDKNAQAQQLQLTQFAQPAIGVFSLSLYMLLEQAGLKLDAVAGHSFGELTALCAAGIVSELDFLQLAKARGQAMAAPSEDDFDAGTMVAVLGDAAGVEREIAAIDGAQIANYNSGSQVVVAGSSEAVSAAKKQLKAAKFRVIDLPVSAAFHTPLVGHAQQPFAAEVDKIEFKTPTLPVYSNASGEMHSNDPETLKSELKNHILNSVQFKKEIESMYAQGIRVFIEFGPKNILSKLTSDILKGKEHQCVSLNPNPAQSSDWQLRSAAAQLAVLGILKQPVDIYESEREDLRQRLPGKLNVKLTAANYVSDKTRQAFEDALNEEHQISVAQPAEEQSSAASDEAPVAQQQSASDENANIAHSAMSIAASNASAPQESIAVQSVAAQQPTSAAEDSQINSPAAQASSADQASSSENNTADASLSAERIAELTPMMLDVVADKTGYPTDMLELSMDMESDLGIDSIKRVEILGAMQDKVGTLPDLDPDELSELRTLQQVVDYLTEKLSGSSASSSAAEQTQPSSEPATQNAAPASQEQPQTAPQPAMQQAAAPSSAETSASQTSTSTAEPAEVEIDAEAGLSAERIAELTPMMLDVVADKTGYPADMLELSMDMESDLGIDSIKRVEILGAMQDKVGTLPDLDPDELSELRTLQQVVDYLTEKLSGSSASSSAAEQTQPSSEPATQSAAPANQVQPQTAPQPATQQAVAPSSAEPTASQTSTSTAEPAEVEIDAEAGLSAERIAELTPMMLDVVADKTGYPADMLELSMDMESDLGIDSIKRVEILGAMQDKVGTLPDLDPDELSELRTLQQVVDYLTEKLSGSSASSSAAEQTQPSSEPATQSAAPANQVQLQTAPQPATQQAVAPSSAEPTASQTSTSTAEPAEVEIDAEAGLSAERIAELTPMMLDVVADKTGYPADMLELSMDMESDLGIDSIKRVEILGAMQDKVGTLPDLDPDELSELRTLQQVVDYLTEKLSGSSASSSAAEQTEPSAAPASQAQPQTAPQPATQQAVAPSSAEPTASQTSTSTAEPAEVEIDAEAGLSAERIAELTPMMLDVVADKTGYPADMLELSMDMESDLGIDSIKRVEILGAMQDKVGSLPDLDPDELSELRTLQQVVDYLTEKLSGSSASSSAAEQTQPSAAPASQAQPQTAPQPAMQQAAAPSSAETSASQTSTSTAEPAEVEIDAEAGLSAERIAELTPMMLDVVADKTGYPADMLELSMDMESDLGIDSIKRVEILGAMQDKVGSLPDLDPDELSELRTLQQVVDYLTEKLGGSAQQSQDNVTTLTFGDAPALGATQNLENNAAEQSSEQPRLKPVSEYAPSRTVSVKTLAAAQRLSAKPKHELIVVVDDASELTRALTEQLRAHSYNVQVVQWPSKLLASNNQFEVATKRLDDCDEQSIAQWVEQLSKEYNVSALIALQADLNALSAEQRKQFVAANFILCKYLQPLLKNAVEIGCRSSFMSVSRMDGMLGYGQQNISDVSHAALYGLTKTAKQEWPNIYCRCVDLAPDMDATVAAEKLMSEFMAADTELAEVAHNGQQRVCLDTQQRDSYELPIGSVIDSKSVFLVSGGAKGVTKNCVLRLAHQHRSRFILLGRSELADEPQWAQGKDDEPGLKRAAMEALRAEGEKPVPMTINKMVNSVLSTREIKDTLRQIDAEGGRAEYVSVDVTDAQALARAVQPCVAKLGAITGLIHGAGVLADKLIVQKSAQDIARVYGTKVHGLEAMLACVEPEALTHVALFSSAAGFYGNVGQSDYSAANEVLNKWALNFKRAYPQCQVLSFNWGPWDGGMVSPALKKMFTERGVYVIPVDSGAQLFVNELAHNQNDAVQVLVGTAMAGDDKKNAEQRVKKSG